VIDQRDADDVAIERAGESPGHKMRGKVAASKVKKSRKVRSESVEESSGNVLADLGFLDAGERLRKAQVALNDSGPKVKSSRDKPANEVERLRLVFEDIEAAVVKRASKKPKAR
jgi:hypothetical protein